MSPRNAPPPPPPHPPSPSDNDENRPAPDAGDADPEEKIKTRSRKRPSDVLRTTQPVSMPSPPMASARRPCLLVLAGPRLGELVPIHGEIVIGRDPGAGLQVIDEGVSRRHARVTVEAGEARLMDLDSTNGTWLDGARVSMRVLSDGNRFRVGQTTVIKFVWQDADEERYQRQVLETALKDGLTRLFNERYFRERLDAEAAYAERHGSPLSVLVANVDRFDLVNRAFGHAAADKLLRRVAEVLQGAVRADDVLARLNGDTFGLIGRETGLDGGLRLADRLRGTVTDALFEMAGRPVEIRLSIGVAGSSVEDRRPAADLLEAAYTALAAAKAQGRHRVVLDATARGPQPPPPTSAAP